MRIRRLATLGIGLLTGLWAVMLVATPYLLGHSHARGAGAVAAAVTYVVGGVLCHQQPTRSFHLWDTQMPVCARCSGLYMLAPLGVVLALGSGGRRSGSRTPAAGSRGSWPIPVLRVALLVAAVPTLVTVGAELMGFSQPANVVRGVSAIPLGISVTWVVGLALSGAIDESR